MCEALRWHTAVSPSRLVTERAVVVQAAERAAKARGGVLDDVALGLPALMRAEKLQKRAARVGFDWPEIGQVIDKIAEESRELAEDERR